MMTYDQKIRHSVVWWTIGTTLTSGGSAFQFGTGGAAIAVGISMIAFAFVAVFTAHMKRPQ